VNCGDILQLPVGVPVARKIWTERGRLRDLVSTELGIERWQLREAIHKIKAKNGLHAPDDVEIWNDGSVTDALSGEYLGNVYDEI
jgi:hypothetical protein